MRRVSPLRNCLTPLEVGGEMRRTLTTGLVGDVDPQEDEDVEEKLINEGITVSTPLAVTQLTPCNRVQNLEKERPLPL